MDEEKILPIAPKKPLKKKPKQADTSKHILGLLITVIVLVVALIALAIWFSSVAQKLSKVEKTLGFISEDVEKSESDLEQMFKKQKEDIESIASKTQEELKGQITLREYKNSDLGFSVQYPSDWQYTAEIFDPKHPITFAPADAKDPNKAVSVNIIEAGSTDASIKASVLVSAEGLKKKSSSAITVRGVLGDMVIFENKAKDQFAAYYFPLNEKTLEFSLNTDDRAYTSVFEALVASLKIEKKVEAPAPIPETKPTEAPVE